MKRFSLILLCVLLIFGSGCKKDDNKLSSTQVMMDTVVTITIWDSDIGTLNGAMELCRQYEQLLSRTVETSDIAKLNQTGVATVSPDTAALLKLSLDVSARSNGAFDATILPLVELWDINNANTPPSQSSIDEAIKSVDYRSITVDGTHVNTNGAKLDLGGIAKGFIADKVHEYLKSNGVSKAIINLGGNVQLIGSNDGKDYTVGIQKPFGLHGESAVLLKLQNKTAVTSGIYERYFEFDDKIYHHVLDPKTGYPADNGIQSVTILSDSSALADSLSTACLVLGVEDGTHLAESFNADVIFLMSDGSITTSKNLKVDQNGPTPTVAYK